MQVAIMSAGAVSVEIYKIPDHINTERGREDYILLELGADSVCDYIIAEEISVSDYRPKNI